MARGIFSTINKMARAAERVSRQQERERARIIKEGERRARTEEQERARLNKEYERQARLEKQRGKQDYYESLNAQLDEQLNDLNTILSSGLNRDPSVDFNKFLKYPTEAGLDSDQALRLIPEPQRKDYLPKKPSSLARLIPWITIVIAPASPPLNSAIRNNSGLRRYSLPSP
jgi:hypothetical protein